MKYFFQKEDLLKKSFSLVKPIFMGLICFGFFQQGFGQVSNYTFAQSSGTYTPITGGTILGTTSNDEQAFSNSTTGATGTTATPYINGTGFAIGFNFTYNGTVYDKFAVNTNGFIVLGTGTFSIASDIEASSGLNKPLSLNQAGLVSSISAATQDLQGQALTSTGTATSGSNSITGVTANKAAPGMTITGTGIPANTQVTAVSGTTITISNNATSSGSNTYTFGSTIQYKTAGSTMVIQWAGYRKYGATGDFFNFQIILTQTSNTVKLVYGNNVASPTTDAAAYSVQVGIRGSSNTDYKNRVVATTGNWNASIAGTVNTDVCRLRNTLVPASGQTYTYTPPTASGTAAITRGPYLQMTSETAITIRWRTDVATDTKVNYGATSTSLTSSVSNSSATTEHEIRITGLTADTKYFYNIGTSTNVLEGTTKNYFTTAPASGTTRKMRFVALGDCGDGTSDQTAVRDAYLQYIGTNQTDAWILLGDNAYRNGVDTEYQAKFFDVYKNDMLKNISLFPAPGNHDYDATPDLKNHNIPYYSNFTMPTNGECGGKVSGKEEYYSFNYGDVHFISLDSYGEESDGKVLSDTLGNAQVTWLKEDLALNDRKWVVVYWHHTPYSKGSHDTDTESDLVSIREKLLTILERNGVDLILTGHSHVYERSYLMHDHFGTENTFSVSSHTYSNSSGKYNGSTNSCPYNTKSGKIKHGIVYVTAGNGGQTDGATVSPGYPHNAMYYSNTTSPGAMVIEVQGNRLDAKMIASNNTTIDQFTIMKDVNKKTTVNLTSGASTTLTASWEGNYSWSPGSATTKSITVSPTSNTTYYVTDNSTPGSVCVRDTFDVVVGSSGGTVTAYRWSGNASATSDANRVAAPGLRDGNTTTDVKLNGGTADGLNNYEAAGLVFSVAKNIDKVEFINGTYDGTNPANDGGFESDITIQTTTDGTTWVNATGWTGPTPAYVPRSSTVGGTTYTFTGTANGIKGIRVSGKVHTDANNWSWEAYVREFKAYTNNVSQRIAPSTNPSVTLDGKFNVYPNPARTKINIVNVAPNSEITVTNFAGLLLMKQRNTGNNLQIDVSKWPAGVYLVKVTTGDKINVKEVIIER